MRSVRLPGRLTWDDDAIFHQHLDQFFHIKGIAFRPVNDEIAQCFRHLRHVL